MEWTNAGAGRYMYEVIPRGESVIAGRLFVARPDAHSDRQPPPTAQRPLRRVLVTLAAVVTLAASSHPAGATKALGRGDGGTVLQRLLPDSGAMFGAFPSDPTSPNRTTRMAEFEAMVGRTLDVERVYDSWLEPFPDN